MASASFSLPNQFISLKRSSTRSPHSRVSAVTAFEKSTPSSSLYEVLGIEMGASIQEIKTAYRKLARATHPDVQSLGNEHKSLSPSTSSTSSTSSSSPADEFIRIHSAYSTLADPVKRADYDRKLYWGTRTGTRIVSTGSYGSRSRNWETDQCW